MIRACGRYGFDVEAAWNTTPREFAELVKGGVEREREARLGVATIISTIHAAMGSRTSVAEIMGEDVGDRASEASPFPGETKLEKYKRFKQRGRAESLKLAKAWRPPGIIVDPDEPVAPWLPAGITVGRGGE